MNPADRPHDGNRAGPPAAAGVWARSDTLTALGRLAGGVAQDFNNLLTVINGDASLLLGTEGLPAAAVDSARRITAAGGRAAHLTRQLLLFSGQQPWHPEVLDFHAILRDCTDSLRELAGPGITLNLALADEPPLLNADAVMLEHLLANVVANARDAMPGGGRIGLTTSVVRLIGRAGDFLRLDVTDEGPGIAPDVLPHIFEPFFTTRPEGHGAGLGLAVVHGIVELHGGWLEVDSTPGTGTRASVFLPLAHAGVIPAAPARPAAGPGGETILLVEDDDLVRETTTAILHQNGYRVLQAASAAQALETWRWHAPRIALLLTDVVLPDGTSGLELAEKFRREKPALAVICTSGFSREILTRQSHPPRDMIYLPKPCPPPVLLKALRSLLGITPP